jgi:N-acetylmuramoyl-L-alanine amidase
VRTFVFFKVFRPKQKIVLAMLLVLLVGVAVYPYYAACQESRAVEALSWTVASKVIVVDPGHGGIDPGCVGKSGVREKEINLAIAKRLSTYLKQAGAVVVMTREGDYDLSEEGKAPIG